MMRDHVPDDSALQAWRQAYRALQGCGSPGCPADDRLIGLVLGEIQGVEREQLADHVVRCHRCTALSQLLLRVHRDLTETLPELPSQITPTVEVIVQSNGEREEGKAFEPPQQSTGL